MELCKRFMRVCHSCIPSKHAPVTKSRKKIAVSCRDFDPPHLWHFQVAQCAWDEHKLDLVLFAPLGARHSNAQTYDAEFRYRMVKAAVKPIPHFRASRMLIDHPEMGPLEIINALKQEFGEDTDLSLIVGAGQLPELARILFEHLSKAPQSCRLLVAPRIGESISHDEVAALLPKESRFEILDVPVSNVTSQMIKDWYKRGRTRSADFLVPNAVRRLLTRRRLGYLGIVRSWLTQRFQRKPLRRLALSMGTFNPLHLWHILVGICALDQYADKLLFIPNGDPPHKQGVIDKLLRLLMLQAGVRGIPDVQVSRIEVDRPGKSYTVDTLKQLKAQYGQEVELCLIVGMDNLQQLAEKKWFHTDEILGLCRLLIAPRDNEKADYEKIRSILPPTARFDIIETADSNVSSTLIRSWHARGRARSADFLVPNAVRCIINHHDIYSEADLQKKP